MCNLLRWILLRGEAVNGLWTLQAALTILSRLAAQAAFGQCLWTILLMNMDNLATLA